MAWALAAPHSALDNCNLVGVEAAGRRLALFRVDGAYFATSDVCPHAGATLSEGCVVDGQVECPMHYGLFDIRTGASDGSMTDRALVTFPVKVEGDGIYVDLPEGEETT